MDQTAINPLWDLVDSGHSQLLLRPLSTTERLTNTVVLVRTRIVRNRLYLLVLVLYLLGCDINPNGIRMRIITICPV
jgi:hypothetical protein